jgi:hypothetical protein
MNRKTTLDDLILLSYNETDKVKSVEIIESINNDEELYEEYNSLLNVKSTLDSLYQEPAESTINNIMNYSKALNVFNLKPAVNTRFVVVN